MRHGFPRLRLVSVLLALGVAARPSPARALPRDPAVSGTQVAFVEAGQLWVMPRSGGIAVRVSDLPGRKYTPRFSRDGTRIAFGSNENRGEINLYTLDLRGGSSSRVTFLPSQQSLSQWTADGQLIFHTNCLSFSPYAMQMFTVSSSGGLPVQLPVAYGSNGAIDDSGEWLAYTPSWQISLIENWKRYRGGMAPDLWLLNLRTHESRRLTMWDGPDLNPMWNDSTLYYLSDEGSENRVNVWQYQRHEGSRRQVTHFRDSDVRNASIGGDAIVFGCITPWAPPGAAGTGTAAGGAMTPGGGCGIGTATDGATTAARGPSGAVGTMSGLFRVVFSDGGGGMPAGDCTLRIRGFVTGAC